MSISPAIVARRNDAYISAEYDTGGDEIMAKNIADVLEKQYPGYLWMVHVNSDQGLINILNLNLSGQYGYRIKLDGIFSWDNIRDAIMRAGGEILERYNQPRGRFHDERYNTAPINIRGLPIGDLSR